MVLKHKRIFDTIHGDIHISNIACAIIDSSYFQRLRYLHQLGVCYFVFPNGDHSRFEHSIGTYYLAGKILDVIKQNTSNNKLDEYLTKLKTNVAKKFENVDFSKYVNGYNKNSYKYDLYGVCNHSGGTFGGHYTCCVKNANGKWYHFNDTSVSEVGLNESIISPKAYVLFYRKKNI